MLAARNEPTVVARRDVQQRHLQRTLPLCCAPPPAAATAPVQRRGSCFHFALLAPSAAGVPRGRQWAGSTLPRVRLVVPRALAAHSVAGCGPLWRLLAAMSRAVGAFVFILAALALGLAAFDTESHGIAAARWSSADLGTGRELPAVRALRSLARAVRERRGAGARELHPGTASGATRVGRGGARNAAGGEPATASSDATRRRSEAAHRDSRQGAAAGHPGGEGGASTGENGGIGAERDGANVKVSETSTAEDLLKATVRDARPGVGEPAPLPAVNDGGAMGRGGRGPTLDEPMVQALLMAEKASGLPREFRDPMVLQMVAAAMHAVEHSGNYIALALHTPDFEKRYEAWTQIGMWGVELYFANALEPSGRTAGMLIIRGSVLTLIAAVPPTTDEHKQDSALPLRCANSWNERSALFKAFTREDANGQTWMLLQGDIPVQQLGGGRGDDANEARAAAVARATHELIYSSQVMISQYHRHVVGCWTGIALPPSEVKQLPQRALQTSEQEGKTKKKKKKKGTKKKTKKKAQEAQSLSKSKDKATMNSEKTGTPYKGKSSPATADKPSGDSRARGPKSSKKASPKTSGKATSSGSVGGSASDEESSAENDAQSGRHLDDRPRRKLESAVADSKPTAYEVVGAGLEGANGIYFADGGFSDGAPTYQRNGTAEGVLFRYRMPTWRVSYWYISRLISHKASNDWYRVLSNSNTPPETGWKACTSDAPDEVPWPAPTVLPWPRVVQDDAAERGEAAS